MGNPLGEPALATTLQEQYVWSLRYVDAPILRDRNADGDSQTGGYGLNGSGLEERLYYLTDANMNVTALAEPDGDVVERYAYSPYGRAYVFDESWSPRAASSYDNNILFAGYWRDGATGLYHVRFRMYHPDLGWIQRDPFGYVDGMNMYEYCGSGPTKYVDPSGLWSQYETLWTVQLKRNGLWGTLTKNQEVWGHFYEAKWVALGEGKCREDMTFTPYTIQPRTAKPKTIWKNPYPAGDADLFLFYVRGAYDVDLNATCAGITGPTIGINLHLDIDNIPNTGIYLKGGTGLGYNIGSSLTFGFADNTKGNPWQGVFNFGEVGGSGPVYGGVLGGFNNDRGIRGGYFGPAVGPPGPCGSIGKIYYHPLVNLAGDTVLDPWLERHQYKKN